MVGSITFVLSMAAVPAGINAACDDIYTCLHVITCEDVPRCANQ